jgi:peptidoglycan/xylan/chitin deacetylase (PgdA/CDA1 family)
MDRVVKQFIAIILAIGFIATIGIVVSSNPTTTHNSTPTPTPLTSTPTPTLTNQPTPTVTPKPTTQPTNTPIPTVINPTIEPTPTPRINPLSNLTNKKAVIIMFDDGWLNQYTNAYPILQQYGYSASFAVIPSYVQGQYPAYMSWTDLTTMQANGFDIVSHSLSHKSIEELDNSTLYAEVSGSKRLLASNGFNTNVFVYPYGEGGQNETVRAVVSQYYTIARGNEETQVYLSSYDKYDLPAYAITSNTTIAKFATYTNHQLTIIFYHQITPSITDESVVSPAQLNEELQYLKDNGYVIATMKDLSEIL